MEDPSESPRSSDHKAVRFLIGLTACAVIAATVHAYVWTTPTKVLATKLRGGDASVRASAARDLAMTPRDAADFRLAIEALLDALRDEEMDIRAESAGSLATLVWAADNRDPGDRIPSAEIELVLPGVRASLTRGLSDREAYVRAMSVRGLGQVSKAGPGGIPPEMFQALDDEAAVVRTAAARALAAWDGDRDPAIPILLRRLEAATEADRPALFALAASIAPGEGSVALCVESLASASADRRAAGARMLGNRLERGGAAIGPLLGALRREIAAGPVAEAGAGDPTAAIASAVGRIGRATGQAGAVLPALLDGLKSERFATRDALANGIGLLDQGGAAAAPTLIAEIRRAIPPAQGQGEEAQAWRNSLSVTANALARVAKGSPSEPDAIRALGAGWKAFGAQTQVGASLLAALRSIGPRAAEIFPELDDERAIGFVASPPGPNRARRAVGVAD